MTNSNKRNRKWLITINNPSVHGFTDENIKNLLIDDRTIYMCMCHEIGLKEETPHVHIFVIYKNARYFESLRKKFNGLAHFDIPMGTNQQNYDYIRKEGKYLGSEKEDTNLKETFFEYGELPLEQQGKRNDLALIMELIQNGWNINDIVTEFPKYALRITDIQKLISTIKTNEFRKKTRTVKVIYIYSKQFDKTQLIYDLHGYDNVYRVTDYENAFDDYEGEDVLVLDDYNHCWDIKKLLKYIDGRPCTLPCRYQNKQACYSTVYITSECMFDNFYNNKKSMPFYCELTNRINAIVCFDSLSNNVDGCASEFSPRFYLSSFDYASNINVGFDVFVDNMGLSSLEVLNASV